MTDYLTEEQKAQEKEYRAWLSSITFVDPAGNVVNESRMPPKDVSNDPDEDRKREDL